MENKFYLCEEATLVSELERDRTIAALFPSGSASAEKAYIDFLNSQNTEQLHFVKNGNIAEIEVSGFLSNDRVWWRKGTSYNSILKGISESVEDPSIEEIHVIISSGGGEVGIVDLVWNALREASRSSGKKTIAFVRGMCASAAYYIACGCEKIISLGPSNLVGSIGVIVSGIDATKFYNDLGVKFVNVVSENAPKKSLDIDSKDGIIEIKKIVDAIEGVFFARVSAGRDVSIEKIKTDFGRGGVMVSKDLRENMENTVDALSSGMIDSVQTMEREYKMKNMENKNEDEDMEKNTPEAKATTITMSLEEYKSIVRESLSAELREEHNKEQVLEKEKEATLAEDAEKKLQMRNVTSILASGKYSEKTRNIGMDVFDGKCKFEVFTAAVSAEDAFLEKQKQEEASAEADIHSEEVSHGGGSGNKDGLITDQNSYAASKSLFAH